MTSLMLAWLIPFCFVSNRGQKYGGYGVIILGDPEADSRGKR